MWFSERVKHLCSDVDIEPMLKVLDGLEDFKWQENEEYKKKLAGKRPTNSLYLYSIDPEPFTEILRQRSIRQEDIPRMSAFADFYPSVKHIFDLVQDYYPKGGVFLRVQLARMLPGSKIDKHVDSTPVLINSHRLHVPLKISERLQFIVGGEAIKFKLGNLYELNNMVEHWVENPADGDERIHLIIDYLPPEYNKPEALKDSFKFKIKKDRVNHKVTSIKTGFKSPKIIMTSVVRGAHQNQSHGGIYIVDMATEEVEQVVDWNNCDIDFSGRGWDRGLRGIEFFNDMVIVAASDELFFYDKRFKLQFSVKNIYLRHAHEIFIDGRHLFVTSTGFDSILRFNLKRKIFDKGYKLTLGPQGLIRYTEFDPNISGQIEESNVFHINSISHRENKLYVSGRKLNHLLVLQAGKVTSEAEIPFGTHNAMKFGKGVIYNDTESDQVVYSSDYDYRVVGVTSYPEAILENLNLGDERLARPGFGRGLCVYKQGTFVAGCSPSTVSLIDMKSQAALKVVNISMDVRNAVHGLEIWPY